MSSNSVVSLSSFNILFFTQVLTVLTSSIKYNEYVTDKGKNISIPCTAEGNVMWVKESGSNSTIIQTGKFLVLTNISADERGVYVCFAAVPPRHSSTLNTADSNAETINEEKKSISASLPASGSSPSASSSILTSTSLSSSSSEDVKIETIVNASATNASTTSSLPMPVPTIAIAVAAAAAAAATDPDSSNISSVKQVAIANKATTSANDAQTMGVLPTQLSQSHAPNTSSDVTDIMLILEQQQLKEDKGEEEEAVEYQAVEKVNLTVRTPPGPVTQLYFKASTILGFLIWRFNKNNSGGYPVRSFTAEFRNLSYNETPYNHTFEHEWSRMDPINIAPNVRQMEVYRLEPNTTYEFRIWANNQLGSGEVVTTNVTTLPETKEEDLIRLIQPDLDNFDPRIWIIAVSVVLGTLVILAIGLCIVLSKECYQSSQSDFEDGWESIELIPNIILNPGFCESDGSEPVQPYTRTIIFGEDDDSDGYESEESDHEPKMEKFKRKVSVFFTGPTIRRI
ncbi:contactin-2 [Anastrepha obliqua]|uniref:contactin-2 n=1 Tax=Anastrepha obliqua TaxID=95512 RepID=UPI002409159A|nr:contactin-2 [Anastrepha obliqua]